MIYLGIIVTLLVALGLRFLPHLLISGGLGVDYWFWKSYIETYSRERQFPPVLPQYVFDEHQWYPPFFPLLMIQLPQAFFERYSQVIAIIIDLLRMALLLGATYWLSQGDAYAVFVAGLVYATSAMLISYNMQLNPRGLAALFLDGAILLVLWVYLFNGPDWLLIVVVLLSGLILLTHKMTTQIYWFLCLGGAMISCDWRFLALIPLSIMAALILSRGFYWKVLKAHGDIVAFWHRNWPLMGANPLKESPIYGLPGYVSPTKRFKPGMVNALRRLVVLAGHAPWAVCALAVLGFIWAAVGVNRPQEVFTAVWLILSCLLAFLTISISWLRGIGLGNLYLFNAAFPAALLLGLFTLHNDYAGILAAAIMLFLLLNIYSLYKFIVLMKSHPGLKLPEEIVSGIQEYQDGTWITFPNDLCEHIAYLAKKSVLWGAHGYGLKKLEEIFPVLRVDFQFLKEEYGLRYILVHENFLDDIKRAGINLELKLSHQNYYVFQLS